jgi:hypothetical protein
VAQAVMVLASILAMRMAEARGYWLVILITFIALPIRGLVAASVIEGWVVYPVQVLDGIGAGLQSVAVPGLVARVLSGTGRVNVGQGAVMTVHFPYPGRLCLGLPGALAGVQVRGAANLRQRRRRGRRGRSLFTDMNDAV